LEALDESAAFAFAIGNSEAGEAVNVCAGLQRPGASCITYFFFRRRVVFFFAARFAFFLPFLFAAIGMSIDSFDPQRLFGSGDSAPQNVNNMRGLHFGMQYCRTFGQIAANRNTRITQ